MFSPCRNSSISNLSSGITSTSRLAGIASRRPAPSSPPRLRRRARSFGTPRVFHCSFNRGWCPCGGERWARISTWRAARVGGIIQRTRRMSRTRARRSSSKSPGKSRARAHHEKRERKRERETAGERDRYRFLRGTRSSISESMPRLSFRVLRNMSRDGRE